MRGEHVGGGRWKINRDAAGVGDGGVGDDFITQIADHKIQCRAGKKVGFCEIGAGKGDLPVQLRAGEEGEDENCHENQCSQGDDQSHSFSGGGGKGGHWVPLLANGVIGKKR